MEEQPQTFEQIVFRWWQPLTVRENSAARRNRAELRRCASPAEVMFQPYFHALLQRCPAVRRERLAVIAGVLAHVEKLDKGSFAKHLAHPPAGGATSRVSDLRFRRLLAVPDEDSAELMRQLIRVIRLLDRSTNVHDLAQSIRYWNDRTRQRWAVDYYAVAPKTQS
jgi:CRISPR system Cascade subunit CasB